jgi:hypothetical protein
MPRNFVFNDKIFSILTKTIKINIIFNLDLSVSADLKQRRKRTNRDTKSIVFRTIKKQTG